MKGYSSPPFISVKGKIKYFIIAFFLLKGVAYSQAGARVVNSVEEQILKGIRYIYNTEFDKGISLFENLLEIDTLRYRSMFFLTSAYWRAAMLNLKNFQYSTNFEEIHRETTNIYKSMYDKRKNDPLFIFFWGSLLGYMGLYDNARNKVFSSLRNGYKGMELLKRAVGMDSTLYDAYYGLGLYNYYTSIMPLFLKPFAMLLGFEIGKREMGIKMIEKASIHGRYSRYEAMEFLGRLKFNRGLYASSDSIFSILNAEFPLNYQYLYYLSFSNFNRGNYRDALYFAKRILHNFYGGFRYTDDQIALTYYFVGVVLFRLKNYDDSISYFERVLEFNAKAENTVGAYYYLGRIYEKKGNYEKAIESYNKVLTIKNHKDIKRASSKRIKELSKQR